MAVKKRKKNKRVVKVVVCKDCGALLEKGMKPCPVCFLKFIMSEGENKNWGISEETIK